MLKERVITALLMFAVFVGMVFFAPDRLWFAGVGLLMAWAAAEWMNLAKVNNQYARALYVMLTPMALAVLWVLVNRANTATGQWAFATVMLVSVAFWTMVVPLWLWQGWQVRHRGVLAICGWLVLLPAGLCFLYIRQSTAAAWFLLGLLKVVWIADVSAYFTGRAFGKNKLAPSISPGKTIEGAAGAVFGVALYVGVMLLWIKPDGFANEQVSWWAVLFVAFFLTYQSILGDLFESWLKRCAGVKDSGASLPGHGGILDRIDAILPVLPLQVVLMAWLTHG